MCLFIYLSLRWVFIAVCGLSLVVASRDYSLAAMCRLPLVVASPCRTWALGLMGSVIVAHGLSCSTACGIFLDQELNPCPLHWQVNSKPLDHQGSLRNGVNLDGDAYQLFWHQY